jgi:PAS domain S-box-containing protein
MKAEWAVDDRLGPFHALRIYCRASVIAVVGIGSLVLLGWAFRIPLLISVLPGLVTMKVNTALSLMLSGISLWLLLPGAAHGRRGQVARFLGFAVALLGAVTLSEYILGHDLGIDELLISEPPGSGGTSLPGRMAPMTAVSFIALGAALTLLDWKPRRARRPAQLLSLVVCLIAMMAFAGYLYHATALYGVLLYTQIALHTVVALLLLSSAIFFARPRDGLAGELTGAGSGSLMARRFLPAVIAIPLILGWIRLWGQNKGIYGTELGLALYATSNILVFAVLVWLSTRKMNAEHEQRRRSEVEIRELNAGLERRVIERTATLAQQAALLAEQAALLDLAQDAIVVREIDGRILFWNRGAEAMYGWRREEVFGRDSFELLQKEFAEPIEEIQSRLLNQGFWSGQTVQQKRDGTRIVVASRWALQRGADGEPVRVLTIGNDITENTRAETRLLMLSERLSLATETARVGVWEWDLTTDVLTWDATMCQIYGFPVQVTVPYEKWSNAVFPEDLPAVEATLQRAIDGGNRESAEFRITHTDGSVRNVTAVERFVLDERANVRRVIGVNIDVTERRANERLKDEFVSLVSHELRTPLTSIRGALGLLAGGLLARSPEKAQRMLDISVTNTDRLIRLINDILDIERIESGRIALQRTNCSAADLLEQAADVMRPMADKAGVSIETSSDDVVNVWADGDRIIQTLTNLLSNAIKFSPAGGMVSLSAEAGSGEVLFSVRDRGRGIPGDKLGLVFERFRQVDASDARDKGGSGLGLPISRSIVRQHGGELQLESAVGVGSVFRFAIPSARPENSVKNAVEDVRASTTSISSPR